MDFYSLEDYVIKSQKFQICKTGITIEFPDGVVGQIWPKSKNSWLIGGGIVEWTYQGEILFKIFNVSDHDIVIRKGDALGQMVFVYNLEPIVEEVDEIHLEKTARGSTGGIVTEISEGSIENYPMWEAEWYEVESVGEETVQFSLDRGIDISAPADPVYDDNGLLVGFIHRSTGEEPV